MTVAEIVEVNLRDLAKNWGVRHLAVLRNFFLTAGRLGMFSLGIFYSLVGRDLFEVSSMSRVWMICSI